MRLLIIDNYDSFTFNLVQYVEPFVKELRVVRNDEIAIDEVAAFDAIILSPGPGTTEDTGISLEVVKQYASTKKILGVCMGMQVIGVAFGSQLRNLDEPLHGVAINTFQTKTQDAIFKDVPQKFMSARYHSWVLDENSIPTELQIIAIDELGLVQAIKHKEYPLWGVQFHPESVLTDYGKQMIENWVNA